MKKKKLTNFLKMGVLLLGISLLLWNCVKENQDEIPIHNEIPPNELFKAVSIEETLDFFDKKKMEKGLFSRIDEIGLEPDLENITQEELLNTDVEITVIPAKTNFQEINTRILQVKTIDNELISLLFNEIPDASSTYDNFSGIINLTTLSGELIDAYRVIDGNAISYFETNLTYSSECDENLNPFSDFCNQQLNEILITGTSSTATVNNQLPNNSGPLYTSYIWRYANNGYFNYGLSYLNYLRSLPCDNSSQARNFYGVCVDKIYEKLEGKAKCVYNRLVGIGITDYHNLMTDLFIEFGDNNIGNVNISFEMSSNLGANEGGHTYYDSQSDTYIIQINSNLMNTLSSIELAAVIVHEISHALLGKHYNNSNSTFQELYQQYMNDFGIANYSHDIMRDRFVNRIAQIIYEFDNTLFTDFNDYIILAANGVYELSDEDLEKLYAAARLAKENDNHCLD